jgi:hypothetical protein
MANFIVKCSIQTPDGVKVADVAWENTDKISLYLFKRRFCYKKRSFAQAELVWQAKVVRNEWHFGWQVEIFLKSNTFLPDTQI